MTIDKHKSKVPFLNDDDIGQKSYQRPFSTIVDIPITPYSLSCGVEQDARSLTGSLQHNNHAPHIHTAEQKEREVQLEGQTDTNNKTNL